MFGNKMIEVVVGKPIPLTLQVFDGKTDLKVTTILSDKFSSEYMRVNMKHIMRGFYGNFEIEMPDTDILIAQYETSAPDVYELAQDVFKSVPKSVPLEKIIVGEVVYKGLWDEDKIIIGEAHVEKENENT